MRITASTMYRDSGAAIERASEQLLEYQRQVASGKRIGRASDDPAGTATAIESRAELTAVEQYQRTADSVSSRLTVMDTALSDIVDRLTAAQSSAMSGRGSTKTQTQRDAAANDLVGARQALLDDLNTSFHGIYIFAGANSTSPAYTVDSAGTISGYQGSANEISVDVDAGRSVAVTRDGSSIAGPDGSNLFDTLDALITAVRSGDEAGITAGVTALEEAFARVTAVQSRVGIDMNAVSAQQSQLTDRKLAVQTRISSIEDANMAEAISNLNQANATYNAALAATGKLTENSLMDYLP